LLPHAGNAVAAEVMRRGYELNIPLRVVQGSGRARAASPAAWIEVSAPTVVVETVKRSEDGRDVIVRLYESSGSRTKTKVHFGFDVTSVRLVNLMEEDLGDASLSKGGIELEFGPFEILTLRVA